ncbi:MAG: hypothetical protein A3F43_01185 [Gammaproteobacteria bacterium RIFCSPHIGHO2_12_FULL_42_10]|nr:MAG: hypothetical protein A3F43_01185 [Gammaproteobacteria bacterium RIFCSPHIGHO2_12_FULL_42_10]
MVKGSFSIAFAAEAVMLCGPSKMTSQPEVMICACVDALPMAAVKGFFAMLYPSVCDNEINLWLKNETHLGVMTAKPPAK